MEHISAELSKKELIRQKRIEAGRKGGKNKKGKKNQVTLDREAALKLYRDGVTLNTQRLLSVQRVLAFGSIKVFRIDTHWEDSPNGKTKYKVKSKPRLVESDYEIIKALDYEFADGENPNDDFTYYFITTKDPDKYTIDSMLDRTFGRAKESLEIVKPPELDDKEREQANTALQKFIHGHRKNPRK